MREFLLKETYEKLKGGDISQKKDAINYFIVNLYSYIRRHGHKHYFKSLDQLSEYIKEIKEIQKYFHPDKLKRLGYREDLTGISEILQIVNEGFFSPIESYFNRIRNERDTSIRGDLIEYRSRLAKGTIKRSDLVQTVANCRHTVINGYMRRHDEDKETPRPNIAKIIEERKRNALFNRTYQDEGAIKIEDLLKFSKLYGLSETGKAYLNKISLEVRLMMIKNLICEITKEYYSPDQIKEFCENFEKKPIEERIVFFLEFIEKTEKEVDIVKIQQVLDMYSIFIHCSPGEREESSFELSRELLQIEDLKTKDLFEEYPEADPSSTTLAVRKLLSPDGKSILMRYEGIGDILVRITSKKTTYHVDGIDFTEVIIRENLEQELTDDVHISPKKSETIIRCLGYEPEKYIMSEFIYEYFANKVKFNLEEGIFTENSFDLEYNKALTKEIFSLLKEIQKNRTPEEFEKEVDILKYFLHQTFIYENYDNNVKLIYVSELVDYFFQSLNQNYNYLILDLMVEVLKISKKVSEKIKETPREYIESIKPDYEMIALMRSSQHFEWMNFNRPNEGLILSGSEYYEDLILRIIDPIFNIHELRKETHDETEKGSNSRRFLKSLKDFISENIQKRHSLQKIEALIYCITKSFDEKDKDINTAIFIRKYIEYLVQDSCGITIKSEEFAITEILQPLIVEITTIDSAPDEILKLIEETSLLSKKFLDEIEEKNIEDIAEIIANYFTHMEDNLFSNFIGEVGIFSNKIAGLSHLNFDSTIETILKNIDSASFEETEISQFKVNFIKECFKNAKFLKESELNISLLQDIMVKHLPEKNKKEVKSYIAASNIIEIISRTTSGFPVKIRFVAGCNILQYFDTKTIIGDYSEILEHGINNSSKLALRAIEATNLAKIIGNEETIEQFYTGNKFMLLQNLEDFKYLLTTDKTTYPWKIHTTLLFIQEIFDHAKNIKKPDNSLLKQIVSTKLALEIFPLEAENLEDLGPNLLESLINYGIKIHSNIQTSIIDQFYYEETESNNLTEVFGKILKTINSFFEADGRKINLKKEGKKIDEFFKIFEILKESITQLESLCDQNDKESLFKYKFLLKCLNNYKKFIFIYDKTHSYTPFLQNIVKETLKEIGLGQDIMRHEISNFLFQMSKEVFEREEAKNYLEYLLKEIKDIHESEDYTSLITIANNIISLTNPSEEKDFILKDILSDLDKMCLNIEEESLQNSIKIFRILLFDIENVISNEDDNYKIEDLEESIFLMQTIQNLKDYVLSQDTEPYSSEDILRNSSENNEEQILKLIITQINFDNFEEFSRSNYSQANIATFTHNLEKFFQKTFAKVEDKNKAINIFQRSISRIIKSNKFNLSAKDFTKLHFTTNYLDFYLKDSETLTQSERYKIAVDKTCNDYTVKEKIRDEIRESILNSAILKIYVEDPSFFPESLEESTDAFEIISAVCPAEEFDVKKITNNDVDPKSSKFKIFVKVIENISQLKDVTIEEKKGLLMDLQYFLIEYNSEKASAIDFIKIFVNEAINSISTGYLYYNLEMSFYGLSILSDISKKFDSSFEVNFQTDPVCSFFSQSITNEYIDKYSPVEDDDFDVDKANQSGTLGSYCSIFQEYLYETDSEDTRLIIAGHLKYLIEESLEKSLLDKNLNYGERYKLYFSLIYLTNYQDFHYKSIKTGPGESDVIECEQEYLVGIISKKSAELSNSHYKRKKYSDIGSLAFKDISGIPNMSNKSYEVMDNTKSLKDLLHERAGLPTIPEEQENQEETSKVEEGESDEEYNYESPSATTVPIESLTSLSAKSKGGKST